MFCLKNAALAAGLVLGIASQAGAASLTLSVNGAFAYDPDGQLENVALPDPVSTLITGSFLGALGTDGFFDVLPYALTADIAIGGLGSESFGPVPLGSFSFDEALFTLASLPIFDDVLDLIGEVIANPSGVVDVPDNPLTPSFTLYYAFALLDLDGDPPDVSTEIGFVFGIPEDIAPFLRDELGLDFPDDGFETDFAASLTIAPEVAPIPLPAGALLLPAALGALALVRRRAA